jgi:hypothetical protein
MSTQSDAPPVRPTPPDPDYFKYMFDRAVEAKLAGTWDRWKWWAALALAVEADGA